MSSFFVLFNLYISINLNKLIESSQYFKRQLDLIYLYKNIKKNLLYIFSLSEYNDKFIYFFLNLRFFSSD